MITLIQHPCIASQPDGYRPAGDERLHKNSGWKLFLQTVIARAYPRLIGQQREKSWMFFDIFLPMLAVSAYVFVYRAIHAPEDYIGFVVVGGAMTAFWMNVLWSMSSQLYWEKEQGNLALYHHGAQLDDGDLARHGAGRPVRHHPACPGDHRLWAACSSTCNMPSPALPSCSLVFFLTMVALYGLGMMAASLYLLLSREAWHISNLAQEPIYLVSGFYFPIKNFSFWISASCLHHPAHPGAGCHAPAGLQDRSILGFRFGTA